MGRLPALLGVLIAVSAIVILANLNASADQRYRAAVVAAGDLERHIADLQAERTVLDMRIMELAYEKALAQDAAASASTSDSRWREEAVEAINLMSLCASRNADIAAMLLPGSRPVEDADLQAAFDEASNVCREAERSARNLSPAR